VSKLGAFRYVLVMMGTAYLVAMSRRCASVRLGSSSRTSKENEDKGLDED